MVPVLSSGGMIGIGQDRSQPGLWGFFPAGFPGIIDPLPGGRYRHPVENESWLYQYAALILQGRDHEDAPVPTR